jgi:hypothetical protein
MTKHSEFTEWVRGWVENNGKNPKSLSQMEQQVRWLMHRIGNIMLHVWLAWLTPRYPEQEIKCPHCGETAVYQRHRQGMLRTMFGEIRYRRAYYGCDQCHQGSYPLDEELGLRPNQMSAEVERLAGLMGVQMPFAQASEVFQELTLVKLSDQSVDKATQVYGQKTEVQEKQWYEETLDEENRLRRDRETARPLRLYGSLDGGRVRVRNEDQPWRELKVGAWFEAKGQPPSKPDGQWSVQAQNITYYTDVTSAENFGETVWATGVQRQADRALELIFLGDGARWIWDLVELHFPNAIQIVDWFHACEYLTPVAKAAYSDHQRRDAWLAQVKDDLWHGELDAVIDACQSHCQNDLKIDHDPAQQAVRYFRNNRERMDYPTYRAHGYQIGSGTIESGVKQIASQRMKVSGARWNLDSARFVAKARAAYLSGYWHNLAECA